jgi:hypothetical protein
VISTLTAEHTTCLMDTELPDHLQALPEELLEMVVSYAIDPMRPGSLNSLSLTSSKLRRISLPDAFSHIRAEGSIESMFRLSQCIADRAATDFSLGDRVRWTTPFRHVEEVLFKLPCTAKGSSLICQETNEAENMDTQDPSSRQNDLVPEARRWQVADGEAMTTVAEDATDRPTSSSAEPSSFSLPMLRTILLQGRIGDSRYESKLVDMMFHLDSLTVWAHEALTGDESLSAGAADRVERKRVIGRTRELTRRVEIYVPGPLRSVVEMQDDASIGQDAQTQGTSDGKVATGTATTSAIFSFYVSMWYGDRSIRHYLDEIPPSPSATSSDRAMEEFVVEGAYLDEGESNDEDGSEGDARGSLHTMEDLPEDLFDTLAGSSTRNRGINRKLIVEFATDDEYEWLSGSMGYFLRSSDGSELQVHRGRVFDPSYIL